MKEIRPVALSRALRARGRRRLGRLLVLLTLLIGYLVWPYVTLWRLDRALVRNDQIVLARLMDLDAIRDELRRRLNKDVDSTSVPPSDAFIAWLEEAIRRDGTAALETQVDLAWVRDRMLAYSPPGVGLRPALARAFFDGPGQFSLRLNADCGGPVVVRLGLTGSGWRVQALYY